MTPFQIVSITCLVASSFLCALGKAETTTSPVNCSVLEPGAVREVRGPIVWYVAIVDTHLCTSVVCAHTDLPLSPAMHGAEFQTSGFGRQSPTPFVALLLLSFPSRLIPLPTFL